MGFGDLVNFRLTAYFELMALNIWTNDELLCEMGKNTSCKVVSNVFGAVGEVF